MLPPKVSRKSLIIQNLSTDGNGWSFIALSVNCDARMLFSILCPIRRCNDASKTAQSLWYSLLHFSTEYSNIMPQIYVYMIHSFYVGRGAAQGKIAHSLVSEMIYARSEPAPWLIVLTYLHIPAHTDDDNDFQEGTFWLPITWHFTKAALDHDPSSVAAVCLWWCE